MHVCVYTVCNIYIYVYIYIYIYALSNIWDFQMKFEIYPRCENLVTQKHRFSALECNPLHHRVVLNNSADTCQNLYQSFHDPREFVSKFFYNPNKLEKSKFLGHCSAPTDSFEVSCHRKNMKKTTTVEVPQLRQPKNSFGPVSDLMVSTEPFFSSLGLASPLPPFPPFPQGVRWAGPPKIHQCIDFSGVKSIQTSILCPVNCWMQEFFTCHKCM